MRRICLDCGIPMWHHNSWLADFDVIFSLITPIFRNDRMSSMCDWFWNAHKAKMWDVHLYNAWKTSSIDKRRKVQVLTFWYIGALSLSPHADMLLYKSGEVGVSCVPLSYGNHPELQTPLHTEVFQQNFTQNSRVMIVQWVYIHTSVNYFMKHMYSRLHTSPCHFRYRACFSVR